MLLLHQGQEREPVLHAPVDRGQLDPGQLAGQDRVFANGPAEVILGGHRQQGLTPRGRYREQTAEVAIAQTLTRGQFPRPERTRRPAVPRDHRTGRRGRCPRRALRTEPTARRQVPLRPGLTQLLQGGGQKAGIVLLHSGFEERLDLLAKGLILNRLELVPEPLTAQSDLDRLPRLLIGPGQGLVQLLAVVGEGGSEASRSRS